jgi:hypothetical protein
MRLFVLLLLWCLGTLLAVCVFSALIYLVLSASLLDSDGRPYSMLMSDQCSRYYAFRDQLHL